MIRLSFLSLILLVGGISGSAQAGCWLECVIKNPISGGCIQKMKMCNPGRNPLGQVTAKPKICNRYKNTSGSGAKINYQVNGINASIRTGYCSTWTVPTGQGIITFDRTWGAGYDESSYTIGNGTYYFKRGLVNVGSTSWRTSGIRFYKQ